jgi:hypothetical protein
LGFDVEIGVFDAANAGRLVGVEDLQIGDGGFAIVENPVEKADQNVMALFGAKDFLEGKVSFGIDEDHCSRPRGDRSILD